MESLLEEKKRMWSCWGPLVAMGTLMPQGRNGFLSADAWFFRAGPGIGSDWAPHPLRLPFPASGPVACTPTGLLVAGRASRIECFLLACRSAAAALPSWEMKGSRGCFPTG